MTGRSASSRNGRSGHRRARRPAAGRGHGQRDGGATAVTAAAGVARLAGLPAPATYDILVGAAGYATLSHKLRFLDTERHIEDVVLDAGTKDVRRLTFVHKGRSLLVGAERVLVLLETGPPPRASRRGPRRAGLELVNRLQPDVAEYVANLGKCRYRAGLHREARRSRDHAFALYSVAGRDRPIEGLAFAAMVDWRLGERDAAREAMRDLESRVAASPGNNPPEVLPSIQEARALVREPETGTFGGIPSFGAGSAMTEEREGW